MSNKTDIELATETEVVTYEPVHYLDDIFPLFIADKDDNVNIMINHIHNVQSIPFFYLMATQDVKREVEEKAKYATTSYKVTKTFSETKLFKCVNNISGQAIIPMEGTQELGTGKVEPGAWFNLPKIPFTLIERVDLLFRTVFEKKGTESIIIFTYDSTFLKKENASDGWGFLVPKQKNTAASCDYEPASVIDELPDDYSHIFQVGSAHSHPHMDAYCSGTDKADQANFDGIHITYGWLAGQATDFHLEMQISGSAYSLTPDQVFLDRPLPEIDDNMIDLVGKVEKKVASTGNFPNTTTTGHGTGGNSNQYLLAKQRAHDMLPTELDLNKHTIIYKLEESIESLDHIGYCPLCDQSFPKDFTTERKCQYCMIYFIGHKEDVDDLIKVRKKDNFVNHAIEVNKEPSKPIWMIEEAMLSSGNEIAFEFYMLWAGKNVTPTKADREIRVVKAKDAKLGVPRSYPKHGEDDGFTKMCKTCRMDADVEDIVCTICKDDNFEYVPSNDSLSIFKRAEDALDDDAPFS